jgi:hypothetical protein
MDVVYVMAIIQPVQIVQERLMVMPQKTTAVYVMMMIVMTVNRTVLLFGVAMLVN